MYECPSFRGPIIRPYGAGAPLRCMMDYLACGGTYGNANDFSDAANKYDGAIVPSQSVSNRVRKLVDIVDGTSTTLLVGEKFVDWAYAFGETGGCNEDQGWIDGWDNDAVGYAYGFQGNNSLKPPMQINKSHFLDTSDECGSDFPVRFTKNLTGGFLRWLPCML